MRLSKAIALADEIAPNALTRELKVQFVSEAEGMVQMDVMLLASADVITYEATGSEDPILLAKPPYDKLYVSYLVAMIYYALGEYNRYSNTIGKYNTELAEYTAWYAQRIHPIDGGAEESGYYLSAYAIAVFHGYAGTEEEWLASLKGDDGRSPELRYYNDTLQWRYSGEGNEAWRVLMSVVDLRGEVVEQTLTQAKESATSAASNAAAAASSAAAAKASADQTQQDAEAAKSYKDTASVKAQAAQTAAGTAQSAQTDAAASASAAAKSAADAERYAGQLGGAVSGGVTSFNGRYGAVLPKTGDYTADMVGADESGTAVNKVSDHNTSADAHKQQFENKADLVNGKVPESQLPEIGASSNPNLLDNWYFADPINQRGQTEYTGGDYTIDRWTAAAGANVVCANDGLKISFFTKSMQLMQYISSGDKLKGKTITLSAVADNVLYTITNAIPETPNDGTIGRGASLGNSGIAIYIRQISGKLYVSIYSTSGYIIGTQTTIQAIKLELGSTQTLAHQDANGNWILNDPPPDKGMELLKCIQSTADPSDAYANKVIYHNGNLAAADIGAAASSEHRIKTYTHTKQLGLSATEVTLLDIISALPIHSKLDLTYERSSFPALTDDVPGAGNYRRLVVHKGAESTYSTIVATDISNAQEWMRMYTNTGLSNWEQIIHTGNKYLIDPADIGAVPKVATYYVPTTKKSADDLTDAFAVIPIGAEINSDLHNIVGGNFAYVYTGFYMTASVTSRRMQIAMTYNGIPAKMAMRIYGANGWLAWREIADAEHVADQAKLIAADQSKVISTTRITTAAKQIDIPIPSGYTRYRLIAAGLSVDYSQDDSLDTGVFNLIAKATAQTVSSREYAWEIGGYTQVITSPDVTDYTNGRIGSVPASRAANSAYMQMEIFKSGDNWAGTLNGNGSSYDGTSGTPSGFCYATFTSSEISTLSLVCTDNITAGMILLEGLA